VRRTASEKMEIIRLVEDTDLPVRATLRQLGLPRSTFYGWYRKFGFASSTTTFPGSWRRRCETSSPTTTTSAITSPSTM
jgi:transposase-like protein